MLQGLKFQVIPSLYDETNLNPKNCRSSSDFVIRTAVSKVEEVSFRLKQNLQGYDLLIGADTVVSENSKIYGKPKNKEDALNFLQSLNGKTHEVYTGVCIKTKKETVQFSEKTLVTFGQLPDIVIKSYVESGEVFGKAGAYGIQGKGGSLIEKIDGDYFNVVGLPLHRLCKTLLQIYLKEGYD